MVSETTPTTQDKQITVDVPEDRVAEFYAFYAHFLAGRRGRRGRGRGPGRHGHGHGHGHGPHGHGCHHEGHAEQPEASASDEAQQA